MNGNSCRKSSVALALPITVPCGYWRGTQRKAQKQEWLLQEGKAKIIRPCKLGGSLIQSLRLWLRWFRSLSQVCHVLRQYPGLKEGEKTPRQLLYGLEWYLAEAGWYTLAPSFGWNLSLPSAGPVAAVSVPLCVRLCAWYIFIAGRQKHTCCTPISSVALVCKSLKALSIAYPYRLHHLHRRKAKVTGQTCLLQTTHPQLPFHQWVPSRVARYGYATATLRSSKQ